MVMLLYTVEYLFAFAFGASVFSFGNVLAYRIPNRLDFVRGRSFCPKCAHPLSAADLVPILGFVFLRGKCRYCGERISPRYPLVEAFGGCLAVLSALVFGFAAPALTSFFASFFLTVIALIDHDTMEIPDGLVIAIAATAVLSYFVSPDGPDIVSRLIGVFAVSVPLLLLNLLVPESFGGGDIKVVAAAGFLLGWRALLVGMFLALVGGGLYGVALLARRKAGRRDHFAFGPFLSAGLIAAIYFGRTVFGAYLSLFAR